MRYDMTHPSHRVSTFAAKGHPPIRLAAAKLLGHLRPLARLSPVFGHLDAASRGPWPIPRLTEECSIRLSEPEYPPNTQLTVFAPTNPCETSGTRSRSFLCGPGLRRGDRCVPRYRQSRHGLGEGSVIAGLDPFELAFSQRGGRLLGKVCEGLAAVHADVKPDNIVVTDELRPVLVDSGWPETALIENANTPPTVVRARRSRKRPTGRAGICL